MKQKEAEGTPGIPGVLVDHACLSGGNIIDH
jgi:hypothetical protein